MALDRSFEDQNRKATQRLRDLVTRLSDDDLSHPVGEHWTVAIALAHLAFWDGTVIAILDATERAGSVVAPKIGVAVNDLSLPFWSALPPRVAAQTALHIAETLDKRLETFPPDLLERLDAETEHVNPHLHRNDHLDEIEQALKV